MVDGHNLPPEMAKLVVNTEQSKNKSARNSMMKGSFYSNADQYGVPIPSQLKVNQEILQLIGKRDAGPVIEMMKKLKLREIVGIRGLNLQIDDIKFEDDPVETAMWNPLHFAVYNNHLNLVQYFV